MSTPADTLTADTQAADAVAFETLALETLALETVALETVEPGTVAPAPVVADTLVRVEKGHASAEELAALTAVLLARAAANGHAATSYEQPRSMAGWRRLERTPGFRSSHSWQG